MAASTRVPYFLPWKTGAGAGPMGAGATTGGRGGVGLGNGHALVLHVSDEPVLVVSVIGHDLHPTVRKLNTVLALDNTMIILGLGLGEVATIGVGTSVLICEGLGGDLLVDYDRGGGVCRGSVDHRGVVGKGGVVGNRA